MCSASVILIHMQILPPQTDRFSNGGQGGAIAALFVDKGRSGALGQGRCVRIPSPDAKCALVRLKIGTMPEAPHIFVFSQNMSCAHGGRALGTAGPVMTPMC